MKKLSTKHKIALVEIVIVILLAVWIFSPKRVTTLTPPR